MSKKIKIRLSAESIDEAIRQIRAFQDELKLKTSLFVQRLAEVGIEAIDTRKQAEGDSNTEYENLYSYVKLNDTGNYVRASLVLEGKDVAFVEFGAGVHFNSAVGTSINPKGYELGYTIGSYGKGQGAKDFWYYKDESGEKHRSYGTRASAPVYSASVKIEQKFKEIAREVFGNGNSDQAD